MRFESLLLASIFSLVSLVAGDVLEKWTEVASRSRSNVIRLDEHTFDQLITTERNYTTIGYPYQHPPRLIISDTYSIEATISMYPMQGI
jgi:hypothetical protein